MKKLFSLLLALGLVFTIAACGRDDDEDDAQDLVDAAIAELDWDTNITKTSDFNLPQTASNGVSYTWMAETGQDYLAVDGSTAVVTRPEAGEDAVTVELTVTASRMDASDSKTFNVTITPVPETDEEILAEAVLELELSVDLSDVRNNFSVPSSDGDVQITWASSDESVLEVDGNTINIFRDPVEDKTVTLTATLTLNAVTDTKEFVITVPLFEDHPQNRADEAAADLAIFRTDFVIGDIYLPSEGTYDTTITWSSSHPEYLDGDGSVTRPRGDNVAVDLTATISYTDDDGITGEATREFIAVVISQDKTYTYRTSISPVSDINPHDATLANASDLYSLLGAGLYMGDFDFAEQGRVAGDFRDAENLEYDRFPRLASELPIDVNDNGRVWEIRLRDDLYFEDGTHINADTFMFSYMMLLDPLLVNERGSMMYQDLNIEGAEDYFFQDVEAGTHYDDYDILFDTVGVKKVNDYAFRLHLNESFTQWNVLDTLLSAITGPVHPENYEALMNEARDNTQYGTQAAIDQYVSYGPYSVSSWEADQVYVFEKRDDFIWADEYRFDRIRFEVLSEQSQIVNMFQAGNLDVAGVGGQYWEDFEDWPNLRLSPTMATFRWAFNVDDRPDGNTNPMLKYKEFRQAIYHAVDRGEMTSTVTAPSIPQQGLVSPEYVTHYTDVMSYRATPQGLSVFEDRFPDTYGFNPSYAVELFDIAYDQAVADGVINDGDTVWLELSMMDAETNFTTNEWVQEQLEDIFGDRFEFRLNAMTSDALDEIGASGNFDMMFYAWQGVKFDPIFLLGYVYNETLPLMHEIGFNTSEWPVTVTLDGFLAIADERINARLADIQEQIDEVQDEIDALDPSDEDYATDLEDLEASLDSLNELYADVEDFEIGANGELTLTFGEWFQETQAGGIFYEEYDGLIDDWRSIAAGMEDILLEEQIAIPLFTNVATAAYSERVVFENDFFHPWMEWGGFRYMYLNVADEDLD